VEHDNETRKILHNVFACDAVVSHSFRCPYVVIMDNREIAFKENGPDTGQKLMTFS
jgi:hypothetical protein